MWPIARLEASGLPSSAQIVTCTGGQTQTTMTNSGSDIILYGLAGKNDGVIIAMASLCEASQGLVNHEERRHEGAINDKEKK